MAFVLCVWLLFTTIIAEGGANEAFIQHKMSTKLENNTLKIRVQVIRPGMRCMLRTESKDPANPDFIGALHYHAFQIGPLRPRGVLKEISAPFSYGITSSVYQGSAAYRLDFSMEPVKTYGLGWEKSNVGGVGIRKDKKTVRFGAWCRIKMGRNISCVPCYCESYLPGISEDEFQDIDLQSNYPEQTQARAVRKAALSFVIGEGVQRLQLLAAVAENGPDVPSVYIRGFMNFEDGGALNWNWKVMLLSRCATSGFPDDDGSDLLEKASLSGLCEMRYARFGINIDGLIKRYRKQPVPQRYVACNRRIGCEMQMGLFWFLLKSKAEYSWQYDSQGCLNGEYHQDVNVGVERDGWECRLLADCSHPFSGASSYKLKWVADVSWGPCRVSYAAKGIWEDCVHMDALREWTTSVRGEYTYNSGKYEVDFWAKIECKGDMSGIIEFPLSLGMRMSTLRDSKNTSRFQNR